MASMATCSGDMDPAASESIGLLWISSTGFSGVVSSPWACPIGFWVVKSVGEGGGEEVGEFWIVGQSATSLVCFSLILGDVVEFGLLRSFGLAIVNFKGLRKPFVFQTLEPSFVSVPFNCMFVNVSAGIVAMIILVCFVW